MATLLVLHEVNDVDHWLASPSETSSSARWESQRARFGTQGSNRVGVIFEGVPDLETLEQGLQSEEAAEAMRSDGVRPETIMTLVEG